MRNWPTMGNCLPGWFSFGTVNDGRSPRDNTPTTGNAETAHINSSTRQQSSSFVNELWAMENSESQRVLQDHGSTDAGKAQLSGMLEQIPADTFTKSKIGDIECPICMIEFVDNDSIRYLPCMHCFHRECVDDWLMRSFTCPSCLEPVDSGILSSFTAHTAINLDALVCSPATSGPHLK